MCINLLSCNNPFSVFWARVDASGTSELLCFKELKGILVRSPWHLGGTYLRNYQYFNYEKQKMLHFVCKIPEQRHTQVLCIRHLMVSWRRKWLFRRLLLFPQWLKN